MNWKEFLQKFWKWLLTLFGFGGVVLLATGAWSTPQSTVYAQLLNAPQWLYAGDTASCIWEVHPNTTKTINSVSYGVPGAWTSCSQNSSDWLLWNCSSVTVAEGAVACPGIRVVQNEFPGTSETLVNQSLTFKTASVKGARFPGCTSADCVIVGGATVASGNYFMRNLEIDAAIVFSGNVNITTTENFTVGSTGSVSINAANPTYYLNITTYRFSGKGPINGNGFAGWAGYISGAGNPCYGSPFYAGGTGATIYVSAYTVTNITFSLNGGQGGDGMATCCSGSSCSSTCSATAGGDGGQLIITSVKPVISSTLSGTATAGRGGNSAGCASYSVTCSASAIGGKGGNITINGFSYSVSNTITTSGGDGGAGSCPGNGGCCGGSNAGAGGYNRLTIAGNITVTALHTSLGGTGGAGCSNAWCSAGGGSNGAAGVWNVTYCGNGTGMDWAKFNPTASQYLTSCLSKPSVSFVVPNASSNLTSYLQNISMNVSAGTNISLIVSFSKDNGSTWEWLSPDFYSIPFNTSNNNTPRLDTHREGSDLPNMARVRIIAFNRTSGLYNDPVEVVFNLTDIATIVTGVASPNGTISTTSILFTCNYTNSSGSMIEGATPYLILDGIPHAMTPNSTKLYYWLNNLSLAAGSHWWECSLDKANYKSSLSTNTTFNITGFGIFYPSGETSVRLSCPFPTISGMTPAGQKAGIGIFRIQNYNDTALHNYTLYTNSTSPAGVTVYAICDVYSPNLAGWTALSPSVGYTGLVNVNSTNSSAYCWLRMDCVGSTPGTYTLGYNFTEQ